MRLVSAAAVAAGLALTLVIACGGPGEKAPPPTESVKPVAGTITVFASSSLTEAFGEAKQAFEAAHPLVTVQFNFAGSPTLVTQLEQGARADVLATADQSNMDAAQQKDLVPDAGRTFAQNTLAVIVPASNPGNVTSPFDLARSGLRLVLAHQGVPAGDYARQVLQNLEADPAGGAGFAERVLANVVSEETNVKAVVAKVQLGEADAGIAYATDVTPEVAGDITVITIPDNLNVIASYPIVVTSDSAEPIIAHAFIEFLIAAQGQEILQRHGFLAAE